MQKPLLEVGQIVNSHGVRGDVKVQSWCDSLDLITTFSVLYWQDGTPVHITNAFVHKNCVILKLQGIDTMEQAQQLKNRILWVKREEFPLEEGQVFIQDILSFTVVDTRTQTKVGVLKQVITTNPAHQLYEVETEQGKLVYIPAVAPFLQSIDMDTQTILIASIDGLLA